MFVLGKTGTGKSTLIKNMALQDAANGNSFCLIDPHGDMVEDLISAIPDWRKADIVYLNVPEVPKASYVLGYNPLRYVREDKRALAASGVLEIFKKLWGDSWGVRMEHILRNAVLTLLETPGSTLADILKLLDDKSYRQSVVSKLTNPQLRYFWQREFDKYSYPFRQSAIAPIQNKVGAFLANPIIKKMLTEADEDISFRRIMDDGKILLVNLAKGQIGEDASNLLGSLLVTSIGLAALSRSDIAEHQRRSFYLYADEFQSFGTLSMANMASELRKYRLGIVAATQTIALLEPDIADSLLGNAGTLITFRLGGKDAGTLVKEFAPTFNAQDLLELPNYHIILKLMIDGAPSRPFGATTLK